MGSIVFQTLRESKALAYSVYSAYRTPRENDKSHYVTAYIGTQADKLAEAMVGMNELLTTIPEVEANLENAKRQSFKRFVLNVLPKTVCFSTMNRLNDWATITTLEKIFLTISINSKCQT